MNRKLLSIIFNIFFIVSCGGGGGGGGSTPTTPAPTVNLSAEPTSALLESTSTLTWSSTNATSCSASWTTQTGTAGSEAVTITTVGSNSFSISCTGSGGARSASVTVEGYRETDGVVVDGYISGAEVCIDEDDSWTCDASENSTTSDSEGKFTIRYANGNLVSIGGTDLDSQTLLDNLLITHKLTGHSDFKAVTPVTSIAAFMEDASLVNAALGIDSSIDVFTFDPVPNKGDGGINDYLYEKGNQLTVLAFALQNITNNLNTTTETTQDYFKAITEEIEKEYTETETKVDIETETFITKALDNVIAAKSVTIDETAKASTTKALASVLPVIEVKSSDDLTTGVIRFAVSTLQTDIQAIANGTATAETVTSYTSDVLAYIAEDQNIDADEITPDISAIADSATTSEDTAVTINVVANDSYLTSAPISVTSGNATNGITTIAESSPEQIVYTPDTDFNGTDIFSYTITQGDKTSSADVTVTIEAVNDAPSIDIASTIQVAENQTAVTTVSISDVDEDELTLTLGGTDADSFNLSDGNVLTFKEQPDYETKSSYIITLSLTDGTETVTKDITIAITNVNDVAPEFTSEATFSAAENQKAIGTVTATDAEGDDVTFTVSGDELAITSAGVLTFVSAPDYETKTSYTAKVTASDGTNSITQDITVNVTNVNEEPVITNLTSTIGSEENQLNVFQVNAIDYEGNQIYYSLSGIDREFFNINSSGQITFKEAPDYETPLDNGADNLYSINIIVSDTEPSSINNLNIQPSYSISASTQTSNNSTEVSIINVDEDLINLEFNTTDGTLSEAPSLSISLTIDELTQASEVQVLTWLINNNQTWYTASKVDSLNWNINESLDSSAASGTYEIRKVLIKRDGLDDLTIVDTALKEKGFDIDSIIYNAGADSTDPILTSIDSISVSGNDDDLNTNIIVTIVASVTDGEGEIDKVFSYIKGPGGETTGSWGTLNSDKTKVTFIFTLDPRAATGTYTIDDIRLYDIAGNQKFYSNSELVAEGFTNSWEISNTLSDNTAPNIVALSLTPSINTSDLNRKQITIDLTTDEQVTDINDIYIRLISPDNANIDQYIVDTGSLFTTTKDGNSYSHTISLPLEYPDGTYNISYVFLNDKALNNKRYEVSELNLLGFNTNVVFGSGNDHAPDITSSSTFTVNENQKSIGTVKAIDADGDVVTFTVTGSELDITSAGVLTFVSAPDYETKSSYSATVTASDGTNSTTQDIIVNVTNVNDNSPAFTSQAIFSAVENQSAIGTVTATDADGDGIVYSISGSDITINSSSGVIAFVSAPDYETKSSYTATVTASDGVNTTTQNITVNVTNDETDDVVAPGDTQCTSQECQTFTGKALDGYLIGAKVFIDQNFNFKFDEGEIIGTTDENGAFSIPVNDDSIYQCLASRPIVVDVPVGAVDTSRGEVTQAYKMALPSINDAGTDSIIISPFTNLLSNAITKAKSDSGIKEDLSVNDGCGSVADGIATKISSEVSQIIGAIEESLGVTYADLLTDFVAAESNQYITTDAAENLADFLPYFKQATDEIDQELTAKYDIPINTNLTIQRETISDILENSPSSIEMNFFTVYKEEPNSLGWYLEESVEARNGILNNDGTLTHAECLTSQENCSSESFNLNAVKDASSWYMKRSDLQNSSYNLDDDNWSLNYEESMYVSYEADGSINSRRCNDQNWLYLSPKVNAENRTRSDRYNTGFSYGGNAVDSCKTSRETGIFDQGQETPQATTNAIFMRLVDTWTNPDGSGTEDFEIGLTNSSFTNSEFLSKKLDKIFENRDSLDVDPLIQEIKSIPRTLAEIDDIRARIIPGSGDNVSIFYTERNAQSQMVRSFTLGIGENRSQDTYTENVYENSDVGTSFDQIANVTGISSQTLFRTALVEKSQGWSDEEHVGAVNIVSGKAIDGYISGAEIFIDKNFNFKKDGDEYTATTDENGAFTIDIIGDSYSCLVNRPIVANVPVGAVDSTLGEVTEAYQMILPSISDSGASTVVISPFSTIFSEAIIKAKEEANIKDELTSLEACGTEGNEIASEISKRITEVKTSVESTYGITYEDILSDFIESGSSGVISEATAQNIATYFRPIKELQDNISSSMTSALGLPIIANITFKREVIDSIFSGSTLSELPLDFYSVYTTETNDLGWRREVNFRAKGAKVDQDGNINAFKCLDNPASDCVSSELNIENLGNFSEDYRQTVGFYYGSGNGTQVSIGNATGVMVVDASDVKYFFESEGQDRFSCGVEEQIQLQGDSSDDVYWEYKYQTNYDESNSATNGCGDNDVDSSSRRGSIEILRRDSSTQTSIGTSYVMPDMDNTTLFSSTPKKLIENFETVDPKGILEEIATFPTDYYELEAARERLSGKEELQYTYSERYSNSNFKTQYQLKIYADSHPDSAADSLTVTNYGEDGSISSSTSYTGTSALETFDNFVSSKSDDMSALFYAQGNVINGEVMDGYISGANVFIDQNFNFIKDSGEVSAKTFSDGSFKLRVLDDDQYACLINRPIVANVPVGAVDSTQGTVTKAYQMILPSIKDAGTSAVVISPYTSLLSEAIIAGKDDSNLTEDLTISEGCSSEGDVVAANITNRLNALTSSIEESFGISYSLLISDFLENSSDVLTEVRAQNVAKFLPYVKNIRDQIGSELTDKYSKTISPNLSLNQNALATIFGDTAYTNVPLEFYSLYKTNPNENGWYSVEQIRADGASLSNSGVLSRYDCLLTNSANCDTSSLNLNNIGNASRSYVRTTSVYKDSFTAAGISGDVVIEGTESRGYRDNGNGGNQFFCETQERIQFNGSADSAGVNPEYRYGFGTSANDIEDCAALANYNPNLQLRVESQGNNLPNSNGTTPVMALQFPGSNLVKTKLVSSKVFKIVDNNDINPAALIDEVAEIPYKFSQLDELRILLIDQESASFYYTPNSGNVGTEENPFITYNFSFDNDPQNDYYDLSSNGEQIGERLYNQEARDKIYEILDASVFSYGDHLGSSAPKNSVIFKLSDHQITATDKLESGVARNYKITPVYDSTSGFIDASIIGTALSKGSIDNFFDNNYTTDTKFTGAITTSTPYTKEEDITFEIFKGSNFSKDDDYFEIKIKLKIETIDGGVKVSWLDDSIATFNFHAVADGITVTIGREIPNDSGLDTWTISSGGYDFTNFLRLGVRWGQVLAKFSDSEIESFKAFFEDGLDYSWKINFGDYNFITKFGGMSSILSGKFDVADTPTNSVYPEGEYEVYEGSASNMCFNLNVPVSSSESFTITPSYQTNKPGYVQEGEVTFSSTTVTFDAGSTQSCVTLTGVADSLSSERDEVLNFTMTNLSTGLVAGRQGSISIILKEN